jgi:hypothetical protein
MTKRRWLLIAVAVSLVLVLAACGGGKETAAPAQGSASPTQAAGSSKPAAAPTEVPKPTAAPQPTKAPEPTAVPTAEEEAFSLGSRDAGLDQLKSYRATWKAQWTSTDQGKTESGTWDWTEEFTSEPKARHFLWRAADSQDSSKVNLFETWQIGDVTFIKSSDDAECVSFSSEDAAKNMEGMFNPTTLGSVNDAKYAGRDTVNGIATKRYTYASKLGLTGNAAEVNGEMWVATDGGYVVKDSVKWKGGGGLFGLGGDANGEGTWTWELSDVNQVAEIKPPAECKLPETLDLPMMPDASEKSQFGQMVSYKTASKVADVVAFYKEKLEAAGWTLEGEPTEMGEGFILNYTKDSKTLSVMISASDGATQVLLNLSE